MLCRDMMGFELDNINYTVYWHSWKSGVCGIKKKFTHYISNVFTGQKFKTGGELIDEQGTEPWELVMLRHSLLSAHLMNGKGSVEQAKKKS